MTLVQSADFPLHPIYVAAPAVSTSFGYEWGYAFGNQYKPSCFWFTRDSSGLWRDLPTMYDFAFRAYGYP